MATRILAVSLTGRRRSSDSSSSLETRQLLVCHRIQLTGYGPGLGCIGEWIGKAGGRDVPSGRHSGQLSVNLPVYLLEIVFKNI